MEIKVLHQVMEWNEDVSAQVKKTLEMCIRDRPCPQPFWRACFIPGLGSWNPFPPARRAASPKERSGGFLRGALPA